MSTLAALSPTMSHAQSEVRSGGVFGGFRPGVRLWAALIGCIGLATAAHAVIDGNLGGGLYRVSVPVTLEPYDANYWAVANAPNYASAVLIDPTLPDPDSVGFDEIMPAPPADPALLRQELLAGPSAKPYVFRAATPQDQARAHYCLTAALYYEAASESDDGMRGVAQVVLNRVRHPSFPNSVCGVVFQGSQRALVCQFTFSCDGSMARTPSAGAWARASRIAADALAGRVFAPVGVATHYHTQAVWPRWGKSLVMTNIIGAHIFHRWRGRWGMPAAFNAPYSGRETTTGPYLPVSAQLAAKAGRSHAALAGSGIGVPVAASQGAMDTSGYVPPMSAPAAPPAQPSGSALAAVPDYTAPRSAARAPAPPPSNYTDSRLNQSGQVREEFQNSGQWIK